MSQEGLPPTGGNRPENNGEEKIRKETREDIKKDIASRSNGNPGAVTVLANLYKKDPELYTAIAPKLGTGTEVWNKYRDECGGDLNALIEKYKPEKEEKDEKKIKEIRKDLELTKPSPGVSPDKIDGEDLPLTEFIDLQKQRKEGEEPPADSS